MSGITSYQNGQADLELVAADAAVLLAPYVGTSPILDLEASGGGLDAAKIGAASPYESVGNWTKAEGVTLTNSPTINDEESHGKGSPTRKIAVRAPKAIRYVPQECKLINLQNAWGFSVSAVTGPSAHGGIIIAIPELPENILWRAVLLAWDTFNGKDVLRWWACNRVSVGDRQDQQMTDGAVDKLGVTLSIETDPAVGKPVLFGVCGEGWQDLNTVANTGFFPTTALTGIDLTPGTASIDVSDATTQQLTVMDSNGQNRTHSASYGTSDETIAVVSTTGLVSPVGAGSATITATYGGHSDTCAVTVTA